MIFKKLTLFIILSSLLSHSLYAGQMTEILARHMTTGPTRVSLEQSRKFLETVGRLDRTQVEASEAVIQLQLKELSGSEKVQLTQAFLSGISKLMEERPFSSRADLAEFETVHNSFLRSLYLMFPSLNLKEMYYQEPQSDRSILSLKALEYLLQKQAQGKEFSEISTKTSFVSYDQLETVFNELDKALEKDTYIFLRHTISPHEPHITPIFVHVRGEEMVVVSLDTLGTPFDNKLYKEKYQKDNLMFSELIAGKINTQKTFRHKVSVYSQKLTRQNDMFSCPVMSFKDVLAYHKVDFLKFLQTLKENKQVHELTEDESIVKEKNVKYYVFDFLPPQFMKTMQTLKEGDLSKYSDVVRDDGIASDVQPLEDHFEKYVLSLRDQLPDGTIKTGKVNFYARSEFYRYSNRIIRDYLKKLDLE